MSKIRIPRRTILRGVVGGAAVAMGLPLLEVFLDDHGEGLAQGGGFPQRFVLFYWGNGNLPSLWRPTGEGAWRRALASDGGMPTYGPGAAFGEQLQALEDAPSETQGIQDLVTVVTGMDVKVRNQIPHHSGVTGILAGTAAVGDNEAADPTLPTIDQLVASRVGGETLYPFLAAGVVPNTRGKSFLGLNASVSIELSPSALFQQLFGPTFTAPGETPVIDPAWRLRRSVLDGVLADADKLRARLGANDKVRLDAHMEQIRAIERRLTLLETDPPSFASCDRPAAPPESFPADPSAYTAIARAHADVLAMALACDFTRVASVWWSDPVTSVRYPGVALEHHEATHNEPDPQPQVNAIVKQIVGEYAYLLRAFRAVAEGAGSLLDNAIVLGTSDVSLGKSHSLQDIPLVIGGSGGGALRTGHHYRSTSGENASKVMLSLVRAMGIQASSFGAGAGEVAEGLGAIEP